MGWMEDKKNRRIINKIRRKYSAYTFRDLGGDEKGLESLVSLRKLRKEVY